MNSSAFADFKFRDSSAGKIRVRRDLHFDKLACNLLEIFLLPIGMRFGISADVPFDL